jgi:hypothetical protein
MGDIGFTRGRGEDGTRLVGGTFELGPGDETGTAVGGLACPGFSGAMPGRATPRMVLWFGAISG